MSKKSNKRKTTYLSIVIAVVALITIVATTLTWLANNKSIKATDVKMKVVASPNLIISTSESDIINKRIWDTASPFTTEFIDNIPSSMEPATHDAANFPVGTTCTKEQTGLKYVENPASVDVNTGLAVQDTTLQYRTVPVYKAADSRRYYYDCTVYLASTDVAFEGRKIVASIVKPASASSKMEAYNACSVDFIIDDEYMGTASPVSDAEIYTGTIPCNQASSGNDQYIKVLMRCYYDGELRNTDDPSRTYVRSKTSEYSTARMGMTVCFTATEQ